MKILESLVSSLTLKTEEAEKLTIIKIKIELLNFYLKLI